MWVKVKRKLGVSCASLVLRVMRAVDFFAHEMYSFIKWIIVALRTLSSELNSGGRVGLLTYLQNTFLVVL